MVTASHNPPQDNGYKVYLGDGSQIVPPADEEIAGRRSTRSAAVADIPRGDGGEVLGDELRRPLPRRRGRRSPTTGRATSASSTRPLHGVGGATVAHGARAGRVRGSARRRPRRPSPTPTSRPSPSPTPRSRARWTSRWRWPRETSADLVVANDPDADRCAVAVPGPHGWQMLRGDEVGALLAHHLLDPRRAPGVYADLDRLLQPARRDGRRRTASRTPRR